MGAVKDLFGIHSPSTVFAGIGENLMDGLWMGVDGKVDSVMGRIGDAIRIPTANIDFASSSIARSSMGLGSFLVDSTSVGDSGRPIEINLMLNGRRLAYALYDPLQEVARQKG